MGRRTGEFVSPRSRPKVLSPDNLAIFVAQLVGKTSSIPPHQPPHLPPYGTRKQGQEQIPQKRMMNSNTTSYHQTMMNSNITPYYQTLPTSNIISQPSILLHISKPCQPSFGLNGLTFSPETCGGVASIHSLLKALLRRHPHHHTSNPSPCSSGLLLC